MMKAILLLFVYLLLVYANEQFDKLFSDNVHFQLSFLNRDELDLDVDLNKLAPLHTANNEEYRCLMPKIELDHNKRIMNEYTGLDGFQLLKELFNGQCFLNTQPYWTFEFCIGKHIRQYHRENKEITLEYYLGFAPQLFDIENQKLDYMNLSTVEYRGNQVAYLSMDYEDGTLCDLNNEFRSTKVMFVCGDEGTSNSFVSLTETQSCKYELLFATNRLCSHPAFKQTKPKPFEIKCFLESAPDLDERKFTRPELYNQFAQDGRFGDFTEVLNRRAGLQNIPQHSPFEQSFMKPNPTKPTAGIETRKFEENLKKSASGKLTLDELIDNLEKAGKNQEKAAKKELQQFERLTLEIEEKQAQKTMPTLVDKFFEMDYCFIGASKEGTFKIEVCYRGTITMFEEDENGKRVNEVLIGDWNERTQHLIRNAYPSYIKTYNTNEMIESILLVYSKSNKENSYTELKFVCNQHEEPDAALGIVMFIVERKPKAYRLYLESGLFCPYMEITDKYGIYRNEIDSAVKEALKRLEERSIFELIDEEEYYDTREKLAMDEDIDSNEDLEDESAEEVDTENDLFEEKNAKKKVEL